MLSKQHCCTTQVAVAITRIQAQAIEGLTLKPSKYAGYSPTLDQERQMQTNVDVLRTIRKWLKNAKELPQDKHKIQVYEASEQEILVQIANLYLLVRTPPKQ